MATTAWVEAQNKVTNEYLSQIPFRENLLKRLTTLADYEKISAPIKKHGKYYFSKNDGLQNQSVFYVQDSLDGEPRVFLDPNKLSDDGKKELSKLTDKKVLVDIKEIKRPDRDAQLVAENIAQQLENRVAFRRAMKSCIGRTMKTGAKGIKTAVSGRLGGADIARTEFYSEGTIPLQTLRADIDYGFAEADTTYGKVGVKVWIYKGEVLPTKGNKEGSDK